MSLFERYIWNRVTSTTIMMRMVMRIMMIIMMICGGSHGFSGHIINIQPGSSHKKPYKLCIDCKYFIRETNFHKDYQVELGKCGLFYELNLLNGQKTYAFASNCRGNEKQCGRDGKLWEHVNDIKNEEL